MSYDARIGLNLDTTKFTQGTKQAGQSLDQVKMKGQQALQTIDSKTKEATTSQHQLKQSVDRTNMSFQASGMAMLAIGTSLAGMYTSISNLNKATINVARAEMGLKRAQDLQAMTSLAVERLQLKLNKMRESGKEGTEEYGLAVQKLTVQQQKLVTANEDLLVKEADLLQKKDDLQDTYILFSTMVANTLVSSIVMGKTAFAGLSKSMFVNTGATIKNTIAKAMNTKLNVALGVSAVGASKGIASMIIPTKLLNLSMGKIILIATGVMLAFEGIAQVIKYFNPEIDITIGKLAGDLFNAMDQTMNQALGVETAYADAGNAVVEMGNKTAESAEDMSMLNTNIQTLQGTITQVQGGFAGTQQAILGFNDALKGNAVETLNAQADALVNNLQAVIDGGIDPLSAEFKLAMKDMIPAISSVADNLETAFGAETASNFINNFKKMSKGAIKELNTVADKYEQLKKKQRDIDQLALAVSRKAKDPDRSAWDQLTGDEKITQTENMLRGLWYQQRDLDRIASAGGTNVNYFIKQLGLPEFAGSLRSINKALGADVQRIMGHGNMSVFDRIDWATSARRNAEKKMMEIIRRSNEDRATLRRLADQAGATDALWRDIIVDKHSRRQLNDMIAWKRSMGIATTGVA